MRIDLYVPFNQKESAKAKGARWDAAQKIWYVIDPLDIRAFAIWMGQDVQDWYANKKRKPAAQVKTPTKKKKHKHAPRPVVTGPKVFAPLCDCTTPPWEDCEHTDAMADAAMREMLA